MSSFFFWANLKPNTFIKHLPIGVFGMACRTDSLLDPVGALPNNFSNKLVILCWLCEVIVWNELRGYSWKGSFSRFCEVMFIWFSEFIPKYQRESLRPIESLVRGVVMGYDPSTSTIQLSPFIFFKFKIEYNYGSIRIGLDP
jgi:hypothetical protein